MVSATEKYTQALNETKAIFQDKEEIQNKEKGSKDEIRIKINDSYLTNLIDRINTQCRKLETQNTVFEAVKVIHEDPNLKDTRESCTVRSFQVLSVVAGLGEIGAGIYFVATSTGFWPVTITLISTGCTAIGYVVGSLWYLKDRHDEKVAALKGLTTAEIDTLKSLVDALRIWEKASEKEKLEKQIKGLGASMKALGRIEREKVEAFVDPDELVCKLIQRTLPEEHPFHDGLAKVFGEGKPYQSSQSESSNNIHMNNEEEDMGFSNIESRAKPLDNFISLIPFPFKKMYYKNYEPIVSTA